VADGGDGEGPSLSWEMTLQVVSADITPTTTKKTTYMKIR
jgi:hypothetical protein